MFVITRPIKGISLNGKEFVLTKEKVIMRFTTAIDAKIYLEDCGIMAVDMKAEAIQIENEETLS